MNRIEDNNYCECHSPKSAIILAAGYGMRMVPVNTVAPKAFLEVNGECLIERLLKQLKEAKVENIIIVTGFMKEAFEYLKEKFNVILIENEEFNQRNNLHSLALACEHLNNTYIIPCDVWCKENPFSTTESSSWYLITDKEDKKSEFKLSAEFKLIKTPNGQGGNRVIGISYIDKNDAQWLKEKLIKEDNNPEYNDKFWEELLFDCDVSRIMPRVVSNELAVEINTYEQLRALDSNSLNLKNDAISTICQTLNCCADEISDIKVLKKGMTNRSFLFSCKSEKYIMRIPGEGTDQLINRKQEAEVYSIISSRKISDDIIYINPKTGYKITRFIENARACNPENEDDLVNAMKKLRDFHNLNLKVNHSFDIFEQINYYESLWDSSPSEYNDYERTKANVFSLQDYVNMHSNNRCLTHIDAVPDNFLFTPNGDLKLIDWEYAGMQDPHVDIAMFCIYSLYNRKQIDRLIDIYFENGCNKKTRIKIYCYIAICGLLWSNWCEYKRLLGVEFGEYSKAQYQYAKDYYLIAKEEMKNEQS